MSTSESGENAADVTPRTTWRGSWGHKAGLGDELASEYARLSLSTGTGVVMLEYLRRDPRPDLNQFNNHENMPAVRKVKPAPNDLIHSHDSLLALF